MYITFVNKTFSFRKNFNSVIREEIRTEKNCVEMFVMPKHLMT